jgi:hypothetical protein
METETETPELLDSAPDETTEHVVESEQPERRSAAEDRIAEQAEEIRRLRGSIELTQQMQQAQMARQQIQGDPKQKEFAEHPYTQFVAHQVQQAVLPILDGQDRLRAELAVSKKYGEETWDQLADAVDQEHNAYLQRGQWAEREKLVYVVAGQRGITLTEKSKQRTADTRATRQRSARSSAVETASPVRRAESTPAQPLHLQEKSKRDAALNDFLSKQGGF